MSNNNTYDQYFDINEKYFPCIDDSAIEGGARWDDTYPHKEFIKLLRSAENMLSGSTNRSIWIHGAYGTGKSKCAYALKKILEVPENELETYWNSFSSLKKEHDLLTKLEGHRDRGIITVYRYATGGINTPEKLFFAIQESLHDALANSDHISYMGENTLKESVIAWIDDDAHKKFLNDLLAKPEWKAKFSQSNSDEILNSLRKPNGNIKGLISNIFDLAEKEGIRAMTLDADSLKNWIKDVIEKNHVKVVFFWDEFSKFFENNRYSLDEFQKIVSLCQEVPFYLVIVTHRASSIINDQDESWKIVQQRFNQVEITLPNNIAFELIGQAFKAKNAAVSNWSIIADSLNARLTDSRSAVMKAANITDQNVIKDIMPIHPMAALVLKNIAEAFASNQRSMFDFIKVKDDSQAFQWFISHYGPNDDHPLLTIDMLWDFFYEKGKDNLSPDIRMILDTFPQQKNLRNDETRVLKTVLIMQAIDKRLSGSIEVLKPTDQNLSYAFEGIVSGDALDTRCKGLAKGLCKKGVLVQTPIGSGKYAYGVAVLAGDQARIDENKERIRDSITTAILVREGGLDTCLSLTPPLRLRFAEDMSKGNIIPVTVNDFTKIINKLKSRVEDWHFNAVIAFSKDDTESAALSDKIKQAASNEEYKNILFIDATSSPLGVNDLDSYVDYEALAVYYQGSNPSSSKDNDKKAKQILSTNWKNRIYNGKFVIYNHDIPNGESVVGGAAVADVLVSVVLRRFPNIPDFEKGSSESQFKLINLKNAALCGIKAPQKTTGTMQGAEKYALNGVWTVDHYWEKTETSSQPISVIKRSVDEYINDLFEKSQPVPIVGIYNLLQTEYGYAPSSLTVFLMGFLLKEYSSSQIRYEDQNGAPGEMSPEKLAELIANCVNKKNIETYIIKMMPDEKAFYATTSIVWDIDENLLTSPARAGSLIKTRMQQKLKLPVWCLEEIDTNNIYNVVSQYISIVQKEGADAHQIVTEIGRESIKNKDLAQELKDLITVDNCRKGMLTFIGNNFEDGKLQKLAHEIGASDDNVLDDISNLFSVEYSALWNRDTGEDQIRKIIVDYTYVKITNNILHSSAHCKKDADKEWREKLKFTACSCEALQEEYPDMKTTFEFLRKLYVGDDILPEQMRVYVDDLSSNSDTLKAYFDSESISFLNIYSAYLEGLNDDDISKLISAPILSGIFSNSRTESNSKVKKAADDFRKNQTKTKLIKFWRDKTGTKTPSEWSSVNRTPILLLVPKDEYDKADKVFSIINSGNGTEEEFQYAIEYLKKATFFSKLHNKKDINNAFREMLGIYREILTDLDRVRDSLDSLGLEPYKWSPAHPSVRDKIKQLAKAEYEAGGSDIAINRIKSMKDEELREYLISLVKSDIVIGLGILNGSE